MPTNAHPSILDRDIAHVSARPAADTVSVLLREVTNHATMALVRCEGSGCGEENVDLAALFLYRHMIEMTDGVDVLVRESAVTPGVPLLRSSFEAWLALEYILEDPSEYRERALSWIAYYAIRRREGFRQLDHTRPENIEFEADRQDDVLGERVADVKQSEVEFAIKNMDELLGHVNLQGFRDAFDRIQGQKKRRKTVFWAELHGGPGSLYALAKHLHHALSYHMLYGYWSSTGHAQDFSRFFVHVGGKAAIRPLREPNDLLRVSGLTAGFLMDAGLASGIIVAIVNARLSRRSFISQRWWERKASAYSDVMEHLARLKIAVMACIEELEDAEPEQEEWDKYVAQWDRSAEELDALALQETFLLSAEARGCLQKMQDALAALRADSELIPQLNAFALALHENMERLTGHAHADLDVERERKPG